MIFRKKIKNQLNFYEIFTKFLRHIYDIVTKFLRDFYDIFTKLLHNFCEIFTEFLRNLTEKREKGQTWVTKTGHAGWKPSEERARYGMKSAEIAQAYVAGKISDDELDKQDKDDKSEEEPKESSKSSENSVTEIPNLLLVSTSLSLIFLNSSLFF